MKQKFLFIFRLFFPISIGGITGFILRDYFDYDILVKPPFSPPSIIFPIIWTILYFLMGIAFCFYKSKHEDGDEVTFYFYLQLFFNISWTFLFFLFHLRFFSILWIFVLLFLVLLLLNSFYKKRKISFYLLFLYLPWLLYATYLNIGFAFLN